MNKELEQYRDKQMSGAYGPLEVGLRAAFCCGFLAYSYADIPVKFAKWLRLAQWQDGEVKRMYIKGQEKELFEYWLNNIYKEDYDKETLGNTDSNII